MKSMISWSRVASSNLASSSKNKIHPSGWVLFFQSFGPDLNDLLQQSGGLLLAAGWTAAIPYDVRSTSATNLASSSKPLKLLEFQGFFSFRLEEQKNLL